MELFVFVRMGGSRDDIDVHLLEGGSELVRQLSEFDAGKAKCYLDVDRQKSRHRGILWHLHRSTR